MSGNLRRVAFVTAALIRRSRVLVLLLLLWPCLLSGILLVASHGKPAGEDVASILEQELFYGLVLAGLGASSAFGLKQRARRTQQILGRAVSRAEYLLALGASAYVPFFGYTLVWLGNALLFAGLLHLRTPMLLPAFVAELTAGLLLCAAGLLCSVLLPQLAAAAVTGTLLAGLLAAGTRGLGAVPELFALTVGFRTAARVPWAAVAETLLIACATLAVGSAVFARRDVRAN